MQNQVLERGTLGRKGLNRVLPRNNWLTQHPSSHTNDKMEKILDGMEINDELNNQIRLIILL